MGPPPPAAGPVAPAKRTVAWLSYVDEDSEFVSQLASQLEGFGVSVMMELPQGSPRREESQQDRRRMLLAAGTGTDLHVVAIVTQDSVSHLVDRNSWSCKEVG